MGEYRFQRFVTDLFGYEPHIATSSEYGVRGQADHGVDVIARGTGGDGQEAGSCKCYERTSPSQIRDWSDEFLEHWDGHWKGEGIRRFVLATTALNAASRTVQDQVTLERKRFAALGMTYEMWGPTTLVAKVRPHRAVATTYLGAYWAEQLCGPITEPGLSTASSSGLVSAALIAQVTVLQQRFSAQALQAAERAQEDLRAGRAEAVRALIEEQRRPDNWDQLDVSAQARLLRLAASLALHDDDLAEAERLAGEADGLALADEPRLAAHIELERSGPSAALGVLGEVTSVDGLQLRVALHVMSGDLQGARRDLDVLRETAPDDPETVRMEALVALASGDPQTALTHMRHAEALAPERNAVRQLGAMARYACALSPAIRPDWYLSPNAFDGAFVREDLASQTLLDEALGLLDRLVASEPATLHHRVWRLAVLSSLRARRDRAREEAADLLTRSDYDPTVVAWCLFRAIDIDLAESEHILLERFAAGADQTTVRVVGLLLSKREDTAEAVGILSAGLDHQECDSRNEAAAWIARLSGSTEPRGGDGLVDPVQSAFDQVRADGDWAPVAERLAALLSMTPPDPGALAIAEGIAASGRMNVLAPHADAILGFRTAAAVRIAAHAVYGAGDPARALAILDVEAGAFGEALPPDMRRLRADALARTGNVSAALREADAVASSGSARDRLFRAELMSSTGNVRGAVPAVREAFEAGILRGNKALQWSRMMRVEDPALARRLLERAVATNLDDDLVAAAMHDALGLQLGAEADVLMDRVHARALSDATDVRIFTIDDLPGLIAEQQAAAAETEGMYLDGALPVHLYLAHDPVGFALLHLGPNRGTDGGLRPWPLRHGARPAFVEVDLPWSAWRLHMDISALLVAARLELLDAIDSHPNGVAIPADVPLLLLSMETGCRERADATVAERILSTGFTPIGLDDVVAVGVVARNRDGAPDDAQDADTLSLAALVESMVLRHALDADIAHRIVEDLPARSGATVPADGEPLLLDTESVQRLAANDALSLVAERFALRCDGALLDQALSARGEASAARDAAEALAALRSRVAAGLESGSWRLMPRVRPAAGDAQGEEAANETPLTRCLADSITAPGSEGAMAWIDDRLVTGFARTGAMPVVGVCDVMEALRREGRITAARQGAALARLRAAGALFLVPTAEELFAALRPAPTRGQRIVETPALETMRQTLAFMALHERHLAVGGRAAPERPDEIVPMQTAVRLLANCLKEVWLDDGLGFDQRIALSDWLWLNARRTHIGRILPGEEPRVDQAFFETIQIAHCLDQGVDIGLINDRRREARLGYLRWFWLRAVDPLLSADPGFEIRLAEYLAGFYADMYRTQCEADRSPGDRRILHMLLAVRVQRLPEPLQRRLYRDSRMSAFGTTQENVTIAGAVFEGAAFWRAVRQTLKYGKARLRFRRKPSGRQRFVRLRREGDAVLMTGAIRARIGDAALPIAALDGAARVGAIDRIVHDLRLEPEHAGVVAAAAAAAPTITAAVRIVRDASMASAAHLYAEAAARLGRGERVRLDMLAPAPFDAVLAAMGITDATLPFEDALDAARRARGIEDVRAGLIETAGVPVLRPAPVAALLDAAVIERARTPMAIIHVAAAARARGRPSVEIAGLTEAFLAAVERYGRLFMALLRWTHRYFVRDAVWRSAPPSFQLAAIWSHADRVLDIAIVGGLKPDPLRRSIEGFEPQLAGIDLLGFQPGPPDVAWPEWMSGAALIHHGLAAIFGEEDPRPSLGDTLYERILEAQLADLAGFVAPEPRLLLRRDDWPNAMDAFLARSPSGLEGGPLDRIRTRDLLIEGALGSIEIDPDNMGAWLQLGGFAAGGLDPPAYSRLLAAASADPARLVRMTAAGVQSTLWRSILHPIAWRDVGAASRLAQELALACRRLDEYRPSEDILPMQPGTAVEELIELAAVIAACADGDRSQTFSDLVDGFARGWPVLRESLHQAVGNLTARTPSDRVHRLWLLHNRLGSR
ncbi:hypothetical protein [Sphingomonas sp. CFBP 13706]|uniref:hypothetical protein n=1 Tax=Sphingomonas sp. CFBP 13706 TaxID=2775314 RepID=UPI00178680CF|nr:hypothetical protein [Sphingomonas sp. CFBP 13706]MBD8736247.1 hypothetical protein [Sphingomonas sp. CFBP 13706]